MDPTVLSTAIIVWTGWGETNSPSRDEARLLDRFGSEVTVELLPTIRQLEDEFYASDARDVVADLKEMGDRAATQFRSKHPEISQEAIRALRWCYTFDYK